MFYKIPTPLVFLISILPIVLIEQHSITWAISIITATLFFALWINSIISKLLEQKPKDTSFDKHKFNIRLASAVLYIIFLSIHFMFTYNKEEELNWVILIIIIGHIFLAYSYFYIIHSTAMLIASIEFKKEVDFHSFLKYFILLVIFPIGIWWLNPKVKSLLNNTTI